MKQFNNFLRKLISNLRESAVRNLLRESAFSPRNSAANEQGVAAIPLVLTIGGILVIITVALSVITYTETTSEFSFRASAQAFYLADAAANECVFQVSNNPNFDCTTMDVTTLYGLGSGSSTFWSASSTITDPARGVGKVRRFMRTVEYWYYKDASTTQVEIYARKEI